MTESSPSAQEVLSAATAAGLDAAAVVPLDAIAEASLDGWLADGNQGEMRYLERHARVRRDPAAAFPGYRSALIAIAEYGDAAATPTDPSVGNISRYALSDDYHDLMKARLREAGSNLAERFGTLRTRALVDANPINEKVLARIAGLGFIGKHSNLIRERRGSWFFCGVLLLSVRLDSRAGMTPNRCGTCVRCLAVCPTGAIVEPYVVDARKCISYLTIELKGPIPRDLRPAIGNRIFGCDDCQEVCPWNRFAHRGPKEPFRPREGLQGRPLSEWLRLEEPEFQATFRGSAVLRTGYEGFLRNVLVAAGNSGDSRLAGPVAARLSHESPVIRGHAAWALGRIAGDSGLDEIDRALVRETDPAVVEEMREARTEVSGSGKPISVSPNSENNPVRP